MKRTLLCATLVAGMAATTLPASAHATVHIAGFQYLYNSDYAPGHGGFVGNPVADPVPLGGGIVAVAGEFEAVLNRDRVDHTFSHCTEECGRSGERLFDVPVAAGSSASDEALATLNDLPAGEYLLFCRQPNHGWMRGRLTVE